MCSPACQAPAKAPPGSMKHVIRPASMTSMGGTTTTPPAAIALRATSSTSSAARYVLQAGGWSGAMSAMTPATRLPRSVKIR